MNFLTLIGARKKEADFVEQYQPSLINTPARNYHEYVLSQNEIISYSAICFAVAGFVGWIFYGGFFLDDKGNPTTLTTICNIIAVCIPGCIAIRVMLPNISNMLVTRNKRILGHQFRDLLDSITSSLTSGSNVNDAFKNAESDLLQQHAPDAFINQEVKIMVDGINNNIHIDELMQDFGVRSGNVDILSFANVFVIAFKQGGNMKDVVSSTRNVLSEKMEISEEIETAVAGSKNDSYIMLVIPCLLVAMMKLGGGSFAVALSTLAGFGSVTVAIVCFVGSFAMSRSIMDIKL
ncbi:MAG: hypothetical protein LBN03_02110 [Bifidobacteriaceae bacterium]|jgi:tight adherence protein B|nr:hypothetical protein [Bifidobacteriaceae bacterium]